MVRSPHVKEQAIGPFHWGIIKYLGLGMTTCRARPAGPQNAIFSINPAYSTHYSRITYRVSSSDGSFTTSDVFPPGFPNDNPGISPSSQTPFPLKHPLPLVLHTRAMCNSEKQDPHSSLTGIFLTFLASAALHGTRTRRYIRLSTLTSSARPVVLGISSVLFFQCIGTILNHKRRGMRWGLMAVTGTLFTFTTVIVASNLHTLYIFYINSCSDGASHSGPHENQKTTHRIPIRNGEGWWNLDMFDISPRLLVCNYRVWLGTTCFSFFHIYHSSATLLEGE